MIIRLPCDVAIHGEADHCLYKTTRSAAKDKEEYYKSDNLPVRAEFRHRAEPFKECAKHYSPSKFVCSIIQQRRRRCKRTFCRPDKPATWNAGFNNITTPIITAQKRQSNSPALGGWSGHRAAKPEQKRWLWKSRSRSEVSNASCSAIQKAIRMAVNPADGGTLGQFVGRSGAQVPHRHRGIRVLPGEREDFLAAHMSGLFAFCSRIRKTIRIAVNPARGGTFGQFVGRRESEVPRNRRGIRVLPGEREDFLAAHLSGLFAFGLRIRKTIRMAVNPADGGTLGQIFIALVILRFPDHPSLFAPLLSVVYSRTF